MDDLQAIYADLKKTARAIAARFPQPDFDRDFPRLMAFSRQRFETDVFLTELKRFVTRQTENNPGHGFGHARKVALDAGTIAAVEADRACYSSGKTTHLVFLAHCAGLLHDIRRTQKDHAVQGAAAAREKLESGNDQRLGENDIAAVSFAICNHEAFKNRRKSDSTLQMLLSGCLYDADKFRWGPDNFTHTVWDMIEIAPPPLGKFVYLYPRAMEYIAAIKATFRTPVGREYGPQFIDQGLAIGEELLQVVNVRYGHCL